MTILPVIDLKGGVVVRGVAGKRDRYRPVESVLTGDPSPAAVARALRGAWGFRDVYVADLDAIAGAPPAWDDLDAIARAGLRIWLDAGAGDVVRARQLAAARCSGQPLHRIIIGLESISQDGELAQIAGAVAKNRLVFSLDLRAGRPLAAAPAWRGADAIEIVQDVVQCGIGQMIVLDLARVGMAEGAGTEDLCRRLQDRWPELQLIGGGGVRTREDVERLRACGFSRVLVASALHDGGITSAD